MHLHAYVYVYVDSCIGWIYLGYTRTTWGYVRLCMVHVVWGWVVGKKGRGGEGGREVGVGRCGYGLCDVM